MLLYQSALQESPEDSTSFAFSTNAILIKLHLLLNKTSFKPLRVCLFFFLMGDFSKNKSWLFLFVCVGAGEGNDSEMTVKFKRDAVRRDKK